MVASVVQERATDSSGTGSNITLAFVSNNVLGNAIHVAATWGDVTAGDFSSVQDTRNNYSAVLNPVSDGVANQSVGHAHADNIGAGANTVQANFLNTPPFRGLWIKEIGGVTAAPADGNNGREQNTPGTVADAVTSNTATDLNAPVLMSAISMSANTATASPAAGTGFTDAGTGWLFGGAFGLARSENRRFTATATRAATYTAAAAGDNTMTVMMMFDEAASGSAASGTGSGLASASGQSLATVPASAAGAAIATATGTSLATVPASGLGAAIATATGTSLATVPISATGAAVATAVGVAVPGGAAAASSSGVGTATAVGASISPPVTVQPVQLPSAQIDAGGGGTSKNQRYTRLERRRLRRQREEQELLVIASALAQFLSARHNQPGARP